MSLPWRVDSTPPTRTSGVHWTVSDLGIPPRPRCLGVRLDWGVEESCQRWTWVLIWEERTGHEGGDRGKVGVDPRGGRGRKVPSEWHSTVLRINFTLGWYTVLLMKISQLSKIYFGFYIIWSTLLHLTNFYIVVDLLHISSWFKYFLFYLGVRKCPLSSTTPFRVRTSACPSKPKRSVGGGSAYNVLFSGRIKTNSSFNLNYYCYFCEEPQNLG